MLPKFCWPLRLTTCINALLDSAGSRREGPRLMAASAMPVVVAVVVSLLSGALLIVQISLECIECLARN